MISPKEEPYGNSAALTSQVSHIFIFLSTLFSPCLALSSAGLPDGLFSKQKSKFG
jgi:hypothetical protein